MAMTEKKIIDFEIRIDRRNVQFTVCQLSSTSDKNMSEGRANVPTNVLRPFVSAFEMIFRRPARYLRKTITLIAYI